MKLLCGDNIEHLKTLFESTVDAVVCDPPYGLSFMGKKWDYDVPTIELWREVFRILKPGGHVLSFGGTRTYHRMVVNIEDAGFEIRDQIQWIYGSGFPKSHDVSKGIDKMFGAKREVVGYRDPKGSVCGNAKPDSTGSHIYSGELRSNCPVVDLAKDWNGWGSALKPANEPIVLARKPLSEKTLAKNVLKYGCGALNIDECRIGYQSENDKNLATPQGKVTSKKPKDGYAKAAGLNTDRHEINRPKLLGRWPANVIFDEEAGKMLDEQSGASRFFYCAKASKSERNRGLEGMPTKHSGTYAQDEWSRNNMGNTPDKKRDPIQNFHPTVKPIRLMEYLCKLITPPNGIILDPFMGSGTTGIAAKNLGFDFIGIELNKEYFEIANKRINLSKPETCQTEDEDQVEMAL